MRRGIRLAACLEGPLGSGDLGAWCAAGGSVLPSSGAAGFASRAAAAAAVPPWLRAPPPPLLPPGAAAAQQLISLRSFHAGGARQHALGVVEKLHDEVSIVVPTEGRSRHFWEVSRRLAAGSVALGLAARAQAAEMQRSAVPPTTKHCATILPATGLPALPPCCRCSSFGQTPLS
jgi:hypothetical protein